MIKEILKRGFKELPAEYHYTKKIDSEMAYNIVSMSLFKNKKGDYYFELFITDNEKILTKSKLFNGIIKNIEEFDLIYEYTIIRD